MDQQPQSTEWQGTEAGDDSEEEDTYEPEDSYASNDLKLLEVIGKGGYGVVYRAIWRGQLIAVKVIEHDERATHGVLTEGETFCPYGQEDTVGAPHASSYGFWRKLASIAKQWYRCATAFVACRWAEGATDQQLADGGSSLRNHAAPKHCTKPRLCCSSQALSNGWSNARDSPTNGLL
jgi:serine/threonine protein kinase